MRRLFSTFARGWPGVGLILLRLVAGIALINRGAADLWNGTPIRLLIPCEVAAIAGIFLIVGLWTPVVGMLVAAVEGWNVFSQPGDPWTYILLGMLGVALALLGPGAWSVDARLFGWKRLDLRSPKG